MTTPLATERCEPCEGGIPPLNREQAEGLKRELSAQWTLSEGADALSCDLKFQDFGAAMAFLNRLAEQAEEQGHHPDFCLHGWNRVTITLKTHAIKGLSRNDFILAAKLDQVVAP